MESMARMAMKGGPKNGTALSSVPLYASDAKRVMGWGVLGFVGLGLYQLFATLSKRSVNRCADFIDPVESLHSDPIIVEALFTLQGYRALNPWLYKAAIQNIDQLLFLENALLQGLVKPCKKDKVHAWTHFRVGVNRMAQFQYLIKEQLGTDQGFAANIYVRKVYEQMQKHVLNVLHMCSDFRPEHLIERAPAEIEKLQAAWKQGRAPPDLPASRHHHDRPFDHGDERASQNLAEPVNAAQPERESRKTQRVTSHKSRISESSRRSRREKSG